LRRSLGAKEAKLSATEKQRDRKNPSPEEGEAKGTEREFDVRKVRKKL